MNYRFGKAFYFISVLLFLFFLLYFYSAMAESLGLGLDESGGINRIWDKDSFFFAMIGTFVLLNIATLFTPKSLETKANKKLHRIFPIGDPYRDYILAWFYSFAGLINLSLAMMVFFVHSINNQDVISADQYTFFFYLMPSLLLVWVLALIFLLVGKFKQVQKGSF